MPLVPLKKNKHGAEVRPIGITETTIRKIVAHIWLAEVRKKAKKVLSPVQYGCLFSAGGEAMIHEFQLELEKDPSMLWKFDIRNFFNEIKRVELVRAAANLLGDSFGFHVACLLEKVTEYILQGQNGTSHSHFTVDGTIQGDVYSTLLACLVLIRAQNEFLVRLS